MTMTITFAKENYDCDYIYNYNDGGGEDLSSNLLICSCQKNLQVYHIEFAFGG